jgi:purine-binding chemotaxis protein CheW
MAVIAALRQVVGFSLQGQRYGLKLDAVERVVPVAEIQPLPKAPGIVLGVINMQGRIVPVVNVRRRFRMPEREIALSDRLILARTGTREVALLVDAVLGVLELSDVQTTAAGSIAPGLDYVEGVAKLPDGLLFIHDLNTFLSFDEAKSLDAALARTPAER